MLVGIAAKTAIAPLERIKISFQTSNEKFSFVSAVKKGQSIVLNGKSVLSLWKGTNVGITYHSWDDPVL